MKVVNEESTDWDDHIQSIVFAYRVNRQESTKFTPFELMYGVKARLPIDLEGERDTNRPTENEEVLRQRVADLAESLSTRREEAKDNIAAAQAKQKERYDLKHAEPSYAVGDKVLRYNRRRDTRMGDRLAPRFTGPYEVVEVLGRGTYRLQLGEKVIKQAVNAVNMKRWYEEMTSSETHITSDEINEGAPIISSDPTPSEEETNYSTSQTSDTRTDQRPISLDAAEWWVKDLNLNQNDRHNLLSGEWLTDKLIDAVNRLISLHMGDATGRQTTLLSQVPSGFRSITGNGIQILHDRDHWVATACLANEVLYADSLNRGISDYVKCQMRQLYASHITASGNLKVTVVPCQRQPNMSDCGVFAAAFAFQWALGTKALPASYDTDSMRGHLARSLENQTVVEFPILPVRKRGRPKKDIIITI